MDSWLWIGYVIMEIKWRFIGIKAIIPRFMCEANESRILDEWQQSRP